MAIRKTEFYEGAALHQLLRGSETISFQFAPPFIHVDKQLAINLKFSTRVRGPWAFTFMPDEQGVLARMASETRLVIGLICGGDGVAALEYSDYIRIAAARDSAIHVACYRNHGEHYEITGPKGGLPRKVSPSAWQRLLMR